MIIIFIPTCPPCAGEARKEQTVTAITDWARKRGMSRVVITDRFWDSAVPGEVDWYETLKLGYAHVSPILPIPQRDDVRLCFGCEVELNFSLAPYKTEDIPRVMRPYRIAKECGCKYYLGSGAHQPNNFAGTAENFARIAELLDLQESDKSHFPAEQVG